MPSAAGMPHFIVERSGETWAVVENGAETACFDDSRSAIKHVVNRMDFEHRRGNSSSPVFRHVSATHPS